jgi:hypothetical protein
MVSHDVQPETELSEEAILGGWVDHLPFSSQDKVTVAVPGYELIAATVNGLRRKREDR